MRKIKIIMFLLFTFCIFCNECKAKEFKEEIIDNVWIFRKGGGKKSFTAKYGIYSIDGLTTYCIESGVPITTNEYVDLNGWDKSPYDEETNRNIQVIGYFGYDYPGHNTLEYRMAAQALIWELTSGQIVEYWTEKSGGGTYISVEKEKNEIMRLVESYKKASFDKKYAEGIIGESIIFTDNNNVLDEYEIISENAEIIDNKVVVYLTDFKNNEIILKRKTYTDKKTTLYVGIDDVSQRMGYFGLFDNDTITLNAKALVKAKLKVIKLDAETEEIIKNVNFKFKIKNLETNEYLENGMIFETKNGFFTTPFYLEKGIYELEEVKDNYPNYVWNEEKIEFIIDENSNFNTDNDVIFEVIFKNNPIKGEVTIYKVGEVPFKDEIIYLNDVEFELYANNNIYNNSKELLYKKDELIGKYTTIDGVIKITNLYMGKYYLKEVKTNDNYVLINTKKHFEIKENYNTEVIKVEINIKNKLKKGSFELTKKDISTGEVIEGATIHIYKDNELVYKGKTNKNGVINVKNLPVGKYTYIETDAPIGYILNSEEHYFEIRENGEIVKNTLLNSKITGDFLLTKKDINTGEIIEGAKINIFDENNNLFYSGETDKDGVINVESIPYGKYKFVESDAPIGYILNDNEHFFEIKENGETVKYTLFNEKIYVPNTLMNNSYSLIYKIILSSLLLIINEKKYI